MITGGTVLLVEDDGDDVIGSALRSSMPMRSRIVDLQAVPNGLAAIRYLKGEPPYQDREKFPSPGLILLDLDMPRMTGFQFLEYVRNQEELTHLRVVVLSAFPFSPEVCHAYGEGAIALVTKPVDLAELVSAVEEVVDSWVGEYQPVPQAA